jgi:hypothetical protein
MGLSFVDRTKYHIQAMDAEKLSIRYFKNTIFSEWILLILPEYF